MLATNVWDPIMGFQLHIKFRLLDQIKYCLESTYWLQVMEIVEMQKL